jgi:uncharacterized protein YneF (UPF0154 family)
MTGNITVVLLIVGLILAIWFFISARKRISRGTPIPSGIFNIGSGLLAVSPAVLIKLGVIEQTAIAVLLAILYFLVFIIGAMLVDAKAIRMKHNQISK